MDETFSICIIRYEGSSCYAHFYFIYLFIYLLNLFIHLFFWNFIHVLSLV